MPIVATESWTLELPEEWSAQIRIKHAIRDLVGGIAGMRYVEVVRHLAPGDIDHNAQVHGALVGDFIKARTDNFDLAVNDMLHIHHAQVFEGIAI